MRVHGLVGLCARQEASCALLTSARLHRAREGAREGNQLESILHRKWRGAAAATYVSDAARSTRVATASRAWLQAFARSASQAAQRQVPRILKAAVRAVTAAQSMIKVDRWAPEAGVRRRRGFWCVLTLAGKATAGVFRLMASLQMSAPAQGLIVRLPPRSIACRFQSSELGISQQRGSYSHLTRTPSHASRQALPVGRQQFGDAQGLPIITTKRQILPHGSDLSLSLQLPLRAPPLLLLHSRRCGRWGRQMAKLAKP